MKGGCSVGRLVDPRAKGRRGSQQPPNWWQERERWWIGGLAGGSAAGRESAPIGLGGCGPPGPPGLADWGAQGGAWRKWALARPGLRLDKDVPSGCRPSSCIRNRRIGGVCDYCDLDTARRAPSHLIGLDIPNRFRCLLWLKVADG